MIVLQNEQHSCFTSMWFSLSAVCLSVCVNVFLLCCPVLCCVVLLCGVVLFCVVLCCVVLCCVVLRCVVLCCVVD
jgi:hypothetical protein